MTSLSIAGIVDGSTLDYPGKVAAVVYLCGCPFRCPWCQNPELSTRGEVCRIVEMSQILSALKDDFLISAACVTGGEPLMQKGTVELLRAIKDETELSLKLDTNGYYPEKLSKALEYADVLAMDLKAPLGEAYAQAAGIGKRWRQAVMRIEKSLRILSSWGGFSEARTTIVPGITDTKDAIEQIASTVREHRFRIYTLQQFRPMNTLDPAYLKKKSPSHALMMELGKSAKRMLPDTEVRVFTQLSGFETVSEP